MNELSLFSGGGGGLLASRLLGWRTIGYVEIDDYAQRVIAARIADGHLDAAPIFTDVREFLQSGAADEYRGVADVVSGGFPCQPFSVAGKRAGADDARNLWPETVEVIRRVRPPLCYLENVPGLQSAHVTYCECDACNWQWDDDTQQSVCAACGLPMAETAENTFWYIGTVLGDLAACGYDARWRVLSAAELGAPHKRDRLWFVAYAHHGDRRQHGEKPREARRSAEPARYGLDG